MFNDIFEFPDFEFEMPDITLENPDIGESDIPIHLKPSQRRFLRAYISAPGNISQAARQARIARRTFYNWHDNHPDFREAFVNIEADIEDFVKAKLMQKIIEGDTRAIIFYLRTYGGPKWDSTHSRRRRTRRTCGCSCNCVQFSLRGRQGRPGNAFTN